jgi:type VI secretion system protein VasD
MTHARTFPWRTGILLLAALLTAGCGAWQGVKDVSTDTARAVFIAKVKHMNLTINGRAQLNRDERGASLPVTLRIYQLKDAAAFEAATYPQLLHDADTVLKTDAMYVTQAVLAPEATIALHAPMADEAQAVGIVAFFRDPAKAEWRLVIPKSQWKQTDPVTVSVIGNSMVMEK